MNENILKKVRIFTLVIGIILMLVFVLLEINKFSLKDLFNKYDDNMWYAIHKVYIEEENFINDELKERYNIDGDNLSMSNYSDMMRFEKYDVKEEQYAEKSKFVSHFESIYAGRTNMYVYLIIGIILIAGTFILKSKN